MAEADLVRQGLLFTAHTERFGSDDLVIVESDAPSLGIDTTLRQASRWGQPMGGGAGSYS